IGHGDFGCRDEVEAVFGDHIHLAFFIGKLTGAPGGGLVDEYGRLVFGVARSGIVVEEVLDEGALELCALVDVNGEAAAGYFVSQFEVDEVVFFGQVPVRDGVFVHNRFGAALADGDVVFRGLAAGHGGGGEIGQ